jgi:uncharacterized caspase-like protein
VIGALLSIGLGFSQSEAAEVYALVVGVNECPEFRLADGSRPLPLRGAEADADLVSLVLQEQFGIPAERIQVLKGANATSLSLRRAFTELRGRIKPADTLVFHYSGHGTQVRDQKPLDERDGLDEALCLSDARGDGSRLVRDDDLALWLDDMRVSTVTIVLDCCHAGTGIKDGEDADVVPRFLPLASPHQGQPAEHQPWREVSNSAKSLDQRVTAWYACQPDQQAYERRSDSHPPPARAGQFTMAFWGGLRTGQADLNRDGAILVREAFEYVNKRLDETYSRQRANDAARQRPMLHSDSPQSIVLGLPYR